MSQIKRIAISGFKSIREGTVELGKINVLIGANGAGKSNFLSVFHMISFLCDSELQQFVSTRGRASSLLHYGPKRTPGMDISLEFETDAGTNTYRFRLGHADVDRLIFLQEHAEFHREGHAEPYTVRFGSSHEEARVFEESGTNRTADVVQRLLRGCKVFQFHDTSRTSPMRAARYISDNKYLRTDAGNLSAFLYRLRTEREEHYRRIVATIRQVAPFFKDFVLEPEGVGDRQIVLNWRDEDPEGLFGPHLLSDGTLRAMALIALLLQPEDEIPEVVIIDEPELGLHPYAIELMASLMKLASTHTQVIVATQSPKLVDLFDPEDIVVTERHKGETTFARPSAEKLQEWLQEYSVGELWEKNVLGGGPTAWSA